MRIIKRLLLIIISIICIDVYAIDKCTTDEMQRLRELANNVDIKYEYQIDEIREDTNDDLVDIYVVYKLKLNNDNSDLKYFFKETLDSEKVEITKNELENISFNENSNLTIEIYSYTNNLCTNELLRTITIKLPIYNRFYYMNKEKCEEYKEFKYCQEFLNNTDLDLDEIEEQYNKYVKTKDNTNNIFNFDNNILMVGGIVLGIILIFIIIKLIRKNHKKNSL